MLDQGIIAYDANGEVYFPSTEFNDGSEPVVVSQGLTPGLIYAGYTSGAFAWHNTNGLFFWYRPSPRCVFYTKKVHISKSMRRVLKQNIFEFRTGLDVEEVMRYCAEAPRTPTIVNGVLYPNSGTWIDEYFIEAFKKLEQNGNAFAFGAYYDGELVGGIYGTWFNKMFYGESMFSLMTNASKFVLIKACEYLAQQGVEMIDCQMPNNHLLSMGAELIDIDVYLAHIKKYS